MPVSFHNATSFNKTLVIVKKALTDGVLEDGKIDPPLLLIGLMYRESSRAIEMEPGGDGKSSEYLVNSPFRLPQIKKTQIKKLEKLLEGIVLPS